MPRPVSHFYEFGPFRLDAHNRLLLRDGETVALMPKTIDTLLALVERAGQVVEKEELMRLVWPDVAVEENNLNKHVSTLRKTLGEGDGGRGYIETVPRRGYRFVAEVRERRGLEEAVTQAELPDAPADEAATPANQTGAVTLPQLQPERPGGLGRARTFSGRKAKWAAFAALLLSAATLTVKLLPDKTGRGEAVAVSSLAVLPFKSLNAPGVNDDLSLGLADNLIHRLGILNEVSVRPTRAVSRYTAPVQDPLQIGRELQAAAVLDGSIQRSANRVRITARLLRVSDGQTLWAETFDEKFADLFAVQDRLAERVAGALVRRLTRQQHAFLTKRPTENPEAYLAYARGRYFWNQRNAEAFRKAIEYFEEAARKDPRYALAYAGLADSYNLLGVFGAVPPQEARAKARAAALRALELDEQTAEAHASLAVLKAWYEWDWAGAERGYRRALELNPNYSTAHQWYALLLATLGRHPEAIAEMKHAQELEPLSVIIAADLGLVYAFARQYDAAIHHFQRALELAPDFAYARRELGRVYVQQGKYCEALAEFERLIAEEGRKPTTLVDVGYAYGVMGEKEEARKILNELLAMSRREFVPPMILAAVYGALGERDRAFQALEEEYVQHSDRMNNLKTNYHLAPLRDDPRFADLLRRVGLPQ
jgi:DNA-binding winged helix-turn-helix (wHTH) protein/TolB-like protein/Tfp pilus assembly protein PilF